ncbi:tetratricopeptide repeat protein [Telmatospirillum sp. J64-1]|uniref:tetratricopeptide repeat protein n=1 Tax=Telmatospirillum sp. J64-1 TaxID=2502183 RepID=UPI00115F3403|nr:tetratricopeptide repeat protein [Telmatospirillum sp. J64-1]
MNALRATGLVLAATALLGACTLPPESAAPPALPPVGSQPPAEEDVTPAPAAVTPPQELFIPTPLPPDPCDNELQALESLPVGNVSPADLTHLGGRYELGECPGGGLDRAIELYQRAADKGDGTAKLRLGALYWDGRGLPRDQTQARRLFQEGVMELAAETDPSRLVERVRQVMARRPVPEALMREAQMLHEVESGDAARQYQAALQLRNGDPSQRNEALAQRWMEQAALKGLPEAQYSLAQMLLQQEGRRQAGLRYLYEAAVAGYAPAQKSVAGQYRTTREDQFGAFRAYVWLLRAKAGGQDVATELANVEALLEDDNRKLARDWANDPKFTPPPP